MRRLPVFRRHELGHAEDEEVEIVSLLSPLSDLKIQDRRSWYARQTFIVMAVLSFLVAIGLAITLW